MKTITEVEITSVAAITVYPEAINDLESQVDKLEAKIAGPVKKIKEAKEQISEYRAKMAEAMISQNRHNIFLGGYQFTLKHNPPSFEVLNEPLALEWANNNQCLKIDLAKAKTLLKREILTPAGFARTDSVTVSRMEEKAKEE